MVRFYFHVVNGHGESRDEEEVDLPNLETAHAQAIAGIRSMLSGEVGRGLLDLRGQISIADDSGHILLEVPFRTAVAVRNAPI
jgi:hypothetical protein